MGLPSPSSLAEATHLPSNFIYGPLRSPLALPRSSPCAGLPCSHEPAFPPPCPAPEPPAGVPPPPTPYLQRQHPSRARCPQLRPPAATHRPRGAPRWRQHAARGSPARRLAAGGRRLSLQPQPKSWAAPKCRGAATGSSARQAPPGERDGPFANPHPPEPLGRLPGWAEAPGRPPDPPTARRGRFLPLPTAATGERPRSPPLPPQPAGSAAPGGPSPAGGEIRSRAAPQSGLSAGAGGHKHQPPVCGIQAHPNASVRLIPTSNVVPATLRC